ncbi:hypothetical protein PG993_008886 [Apiospora rasikravindrae]|uniref:Uncharacterized protein n=1 Tax=Apiospora rasikravindrae TaxID=990691 RepID=A0ABR1SPL8_9PEZI
MAKISPLAAKTLHNILANHADALAKKAPEVNPAFVPLPKQTEDEVDELTFTYADFSASDGSWGGGGSDDVSNSTGFTAGISTAEDLWSPDGASTSADGTSTSPNGTTSDAASVWASWEDPSTKTTSQESVADLWFGPGTADSGTFMSPANSAAADRDGSEWGWESRGDRKAKMDAYKTYRVQQWTPRQLELIRYRGLFNGPSENREYDQLLAMRFMKERALDFANRRRSRARSRFDEHRDQLAKGLENEKAHSITEPQRTGKNRWLSMTADEL